MVRYRKDIDGLRGIAVLPVILYHYKIPGFKGGFTGVDIFFVISGYLIGSIILSELTENTFSFARFYERRIRRIIPAFYTTLVACLLFAFFFLDSQFLQELAQTAAAAVLLYSNVFFYHTTGSYFSMETGANVLLHTWSLSLEEQFYLIFPPFIYLLYKYARQYLFYIIAVITLASLTASILLTKEHIVFSFYLPFTRCWEFFAGLLVSKIPANLSKRTGSGLLSLAGLLFIVAGIAFLDKDSVFPGYNALLPVTGAALLLRYGNDSGMINRILCFRPLVFTGKISYSLYLWHFPVIVFAEYFMYDTFRPGNILIVLLITFGLSIISWRYVEQPFRLKKQKGNLKKAFGYGILAFVCLTGICLLTNRQAGFPDRSPQNAMLKKLRTDRYATHEKLRPYNTHLKSPDSLDHLAVMGDTATLPSFILWGDSHAGRLLPQFEAVCQAKRRSGYGAITAGYPPILTQRSAETSIFRFITLHPEIKQVFLIARWAHHRNKAALQGKESVFDEALIHTVDALVKTGREVILFTHLPELETIPKKYFFQSKLLRQDINDLTPTREQYLNSSKTMLDLLIRLGDLPHVHTVVTYPYFFRNGRMLLSDQGHLLFNDNHHLSQAGAMRLKALIEQELP